MLRLSNCFAASFICLFVLDASTLVARSANVLKDTPEDLYVNTDSSLTPGTIWRGQELSIDGAAFTVDGKDTEMYLVSVFVGGVEKADAKPAALIVRNGGFVSAGSLNIGETGSYSYQSFPNIASLNIDGARVATELRFAMGKQTTATINIVNGGVLNNNNGFTGPGTGSAFINVRGKGSQLNAIAGQFWVAEGGQSTLNITDGGIVNITPLIIGPYRYGNLMTSGINIHTINSSVVNIKGAGSQLNVTDGDVFVDGESGDSLNISEGGKINSVNGSIGRLVFDNVSRMKTGIGQVSIEGKDSLWTMKHTLFLDIETSKAVLNIGSPADKAATEPGNIIAPDGIQFGAGEGIINFNHNSNHYVFSTALIADPTGDASATINQYAGRTILTADNSDYHGDTNIQGGDLVIDGQYGAAGKAGAIHLINGALYLGNSDIVIYTPVTMDSGTTMGGFGTVNGNLDLTPASHLIGGMDGVAGEFQIKGDLTVERSAYFDIYVNANGDTSLFNIDGVITSNDTANINIVSYGLGSNPSEKGYAKTVIKTRGRLDPNKFQIMAAGNKLINVDYLQGVTGEVQKGDKGDDFVVNLGTLSWDSTVIRDSGQYAAHGNFTLNGSGSFTVLSDLNDRSGEIGLSSETGWDGNSLNKMGDGTLILDGNNGYTGLTSLKQGQLLIGGSSDYKSATIGGDVTAASGATLGGFGTIHGKVEMGSGSRLLPGSSTSYGQFTMGGLVLDSGSNFIFNADADGSSNSIVVTSKYGNSGEIKINSGATLTINGLGSGSWTDAGTHYTLATADKGIEGQFTIIVNNLAFLDYGLTYNPNDIVINLSRNDTHFDDIGTSYNQINTGAAIDGLSSTNAIYKAFLPLTQDQARAAFDNLSGEIYGSTRSALFNNSRYLRDAMNRRMLSASRLPSDDPVWFSSWGHGGRISGDGNGVGVDNSGWGIALGLDGEITDKAFAGFLLSYENSEIKNDGTRSSKSDVDSYQIGGYAATELNGIQLRGGLSYSYLDLSTKRHIWVNDLKGKVRSDYDGYQVQLFAEASKDFRIQDEATLSPYFNLAQVWLHLDNADEQGSEAALSIDGETDSVFLTTLGLRGNYKLSTKLPMSLYGDVAWVHSYGDTDGATTNRFGNLGSRFSIKGVGMGENVAVIGTGIETKITKNSTFTLGYQGQLGSGQSDHSAHIDWKLKF